MWYLFNFQLRALIVGGIATMGAFGAGVVLLYPRDVPNDGLIAFIFIVRLVVPSVLIGMAAGWLSVKIWPQ